MTKWLRFEFSVRLIAWIGVCLFGIFNALRIIQIFPGNTGVTVLIWIFFFATLITGFLDMWRFPERNKVS
jgi:hypothetical protein